MAPTPAASDPIPTTTATSCGVLSEALLDDGNLCADGRIIGNKVQPAMIALGCPDNAPQGAVCPFGNAGNDETNLCAGGPCWKCIDRQSVQDFVAVACKASTLAPKPAPKAS